MGVLNVMYTKVLQKHCLLDMRQLKISMCKGYKNCMVAVYLDYLAVEDFSNPTLLSIINSLPNTVAAALLMLIQM